MFCSENRPREACGIFGILDHKDAAQLTYFGLYALQHRGQESAGISVLSDDKKIQCKKGMGLVPDVFSKEDLESLKGNLAIGHVRYSTAGNSMVENTQPFLVQHKNMSFALVHNGNLTNSHILKKELEDDGSIFQTTMDSEIAIHVFVKNLKGNNLETALVKTAEKLEGAFSFIAMTSNGELIGIKDPHSFRPLCIGKLNGKYVLSSETCALDLVQAEFLRELEPGEIVIINKDGIRSINSPKPAKRAFCIFEYIYFARPDSTFFGKNVYEMRKSHGIQLAKEAPVDADIVMPFPDSGVYAAIGYSKESKIPFEMGMIRNHYVGRTFIQPTQEMREFGVRIKLNPVKEVLKNKEIIIVEDSIIRGTTAKTRVKALRDLGVKKIHMRISCPPHRFPCVYGIDFSSRGELVAAKKTVDELRTYLDLDTLHYLSLEGLLESTGISLPDQGFCKACFDGEYPVSFSK
ncbi:MAG: amidophosphoribosyltransferase [Desulforegulaceae bacterium]|nr:amidophosphoribosyltransferase [Desulforegulaceae bacterium]